MWKVDRPAADARQTFVTCISRIRDAELRARLELIQDDIASAAEAFEIAADRTELHALATSSVIAGLVTKHEMGAVYTDRMAKKQSPARFIYDQIMSGPPHARCPLCGHRTVSTLDHHLPKAQYPALAVTPLNLVPSCADCNNAKKNSVPRMRTEETLHPYFDDVENLQWLRATVNEGPSAVLRFFVDPPAAWDIDLSTRVREHFKKLRLAALYGSQAAEELLNIRDYLSTLFSSAGEIQVKRHLDEFAVSCAGNRLNSWQTATYQALAKSSWYWTGGFALER